MLGSSSPWASGCSWSILAGITNELGSITSQLSDAKDKIAGWLQDIGVDPNTATNAKDEASRSVNDAGSALLTGLGEGIKALSGLAFFLALTALSLFFLLEGRAQDPRRGASATWACRCDVAK